MGPLFCFGYLLVAFVAPIIAEVSDASHHPSLEEVVLRLERQLEELQRRQDDDHALLLRLQNPPSTDDSGANPAFKVNDTRRALEQESVALRGLDVQLTGLREELSVLIRNKEKESDVNSDIGELRMEADALQSDVRKLKADVERLRERRERETSALGQLKARQVAMRWLQKSVEELRTELGELAAVQNVSSALRQRQQCEAGMALLRSDVASLRSETEELRAGHEINGALLRQVQQDVAEIRSQQRHATTTGQLLKEEMSKLKEEITTLNTDFSSRAKKIKEISSHQRENNEIQANNFWSYVAGTEKRRLRHHGGLRADVYAVITKQAEFEKQLQELHHNFSALAASTEHARMQVLLLTNQTSVGGKQMPVVNRSLEELRRRITALEEEGAGWREATRNASVAASGVVKLHASTVQLFEALETLESECEKGVGTLRQEMSKVEFNVAQMTSSMTILKEDQGAQSDSFRSGQRAVAQLQATVDGHALRLLSLEARDINATVRECEESNARLLTSVRLSQLEERLHRLSRRREAFTSDATEDKLLNLTIQFPSIFTQVAQVKEATLMLVHHLPSDCGAVKGLTAAGVSLLHPKGLGDTAIEAFCLLSSSDEENSGAWTVIQRRVNSAEDFHRTWQEYKKGFGSVEGSHWLGNDAIHALTSNASYSLRVELWDGEGRFRFAHYDSFRIDSEEDFYRLHVHGYSGNASDALAMHDNMAFSTKDVDHDMSSTHCALFYLGGWWYNRCQQANANGQYNVGLTWYDADVHAWLQLSRIQMMIRRKDPT